MLSTFKHFIPLPLRIGIKWTGYAIQDIIDPVKTTRVPPRRKTFIGGGDFAAVGDGFFEILKQYGFRPDMTILEAGCGQGRMARPMVDVLTGDYHGFDIDKSGIEWCKTQYADKSNFHFTHANILNALYNPSGLITAKDFAFPYDDNIFDCVFLTSVFTHMFKEDIDNYMAEIKRVLKTDGRALISWYLWEDGLKNPKMDFRFSVDNVSRTTLKQNPEAALAFDLSWVKALYDTYDLAIEAIERGSWSGGPGRMGLQDLIIARHKTNTPELEHKAV